MKFTLATTLGMLAVASGHQFKMHFPRDNSTASAVESSVKNPFPTAPSSQDIHPTQPALTTKVTQEVTVKTITVTLGSGPDKTVKTSTLPVTIDKTITVGAEQTTTTTSTKHLTRTVTVVRPEASAPANGEKAAAGGDDKVTVTVTAPASTVYVTLPCDQNQATALPTGVNSAAAVNNNDNGGGQSEEPCPDVTTTMQLTTTVQSTLVVKPYPTGSSNGTSTDGSAKPSGFARLARLRR